MVPSHNVRRLVASTAILSTVLAFGCTAVALVAVRFNFGAFDDPLGQIGVGAGAGRLLYWSMILDMFGYYLLLIPSVLYLWDWMRRRASFGATLYTLCGLAYALVGAIGAAILAAVWPSMIERYAVASGAEREGILNSFTFVTNMVHGGLWNTLEMVLAGVWWLGMGLLLRHERRAFGVATIALGAACLVDSAGNLLGLPALAAPGLNVYLVLAPVWACRLGVLVVRGRAASTFDASALEAIHFAKRNARTEELGAPALAAYAAAAGHAFNAAEPVAGNPG